MNVWACAAVAIATIGVVALAGTIGHYATRPCGTVTTITAEEFNGRLPSCTNLVIRKSP